MVGRRGLPISVEHVGCTILCSFDMTRMCYRVRYVRRKDRDRGLGWDFYIDESMHPRDWMRLLPWSDVMPLRERYGWEVATAKLLIGTGPWPAR